MKLTIPLYQEKFRHEGADQYFVRPLFVEGVEAVRDELKRATDSVRNSLRAMLLAQSRQPRHDLLGLTTQCPDMREEHVKLRIRLKRRSIEATYLFAVFEQAGSRVAFTPRLPHLMFELARGEELAARAEEVLTAHYRKLEKELDTVEPAQDAVRGSAWISQLDLSIEFEALHVQPRGQDRAEIGGFAQMDGADELHKVGRLVDALYPDDLDRAVRREALVSELSALLSDADRRPVLLLGRSGVGKTALVHEVVRRGLEAKASGGRRRGQVWLISPQRLISGMSFVGQWENRVHAILGECRRRDHVLYFDDILGLFRAGISASSRVSAAQVLKPHIEKHETRLLVEMSPEQLQVLKELDRGFADMFHVVPVDEPDEQETLRILIHSQRELEARFHCRFGHDVLPTALDLTRRYQREIAMPGKVAGFLAQLANKHRDAGITRLHVLYEFEARSGLRVSFLDENARMFREQVDRDLRATIVGQDAAVRAMVDVVTVAKSRLNDPGRPLGSLLFLGPTGVGKTESAKALAGLLFGDPAALLRFDMNEFVDASSVARLAGTMSEPEGLLTGAVRRRPFAVILLDEIEKAHPGAFDVLLQVLGEARLTDALGRTTDFSNCVIIMTSNLGVREADGGLGVAGHESRGDDAYSQAARRFFRPEFFNRIDRIVPFQRLTRDEVETIAQHQLQEVFAREGLSRRRCVLQVDAPAMERVVDKGYHPRLGARAIKREIERQLTRPLSARLAELNPEVPTIVRLMARGDDVTVGLTPLEAESPSPRAGVRVPLDNVDAVVSRMDNVLNQAESLLAGLAPEGAIPGSSVTPALRRYFALREQVGYLDNAVERFLDWREAQADRPAPPEAGASTISENRPRRSPLAEALPAPPDAWLALRTPNELRGFLSARAEDTGESQLTGRLRRLLAATALLNLMLERPAREDERVLLVLRTVNGRHSPAPGWLAGSFSALLRHRVDLGVDRLESSRPGEVALVVSGYLGEALCGAMAGLYLWCWEGGFQPVQVIARTIEPGDDPGARLADLNTRQREWAEGVARGDASPDDDPLPCGRVIQVHYNSAQALDLRCGQVSREHPSLSLLWTWLMLSFDVPEGEA
ncbi:MAG: AAA family ATPase [Planctomycetes bacterium]|nr:AAA family ATPase [Planctomycetota bacterium]